MKSMLIGIDDAKSSIKAVEYVAQQFSGASDLRITLVHVLPNLPAIFWDEGHILSDSEKKERQKVVDKWLTDRKAKMEPILRSAVELLAKSGIPQKQVQTKFISDSMDAAESILEEAKDNNHQTIVVGRRGASDGTRVAIGSVSSRIVSLGSGVAVLIVE